MDIDWDNTMAWFPTSLLIAQEGLIDMRNDVARAARYARRRYVTIVEKRHDLAT